MIRISRHASPIWDVFIRLQYVHHKCMCFVSIGHVNDGDFVHDQDGRGSRFNLRLDSTDILYSPTDHNDTSQQNAAHRAVCLLQD